MITPSCTEKAQESPGFQRGRWGTHLGVVGQHVIPQDRCPSIWHLADVGDHHDWQGVGLQSVGTDRE